MSEKYTERLHLKVRPSEKQKIKTRAMMAGVSLSDFLRQTAVISIIQPRQDLSELIAAVNAIGRNFNQISKHCNMHPHNPFTRPITISICQCEEMLEQLIAHVKRRK
ncbi:plasmid mobilization protein [Sneathiella sp.]|uniref:plasmid mobilization protein n=1 Tax=Sneathiella sp. TaxID=1964365 RepID=UPI0039E367D5